MKWLKKLFGISEPEPWDKPWPRVYGSSAPEMDPASPFYGNSVSDCAKRAWMAAPAKAASQYPPEGIFYGGERASRSYLKSVRDEWQRDQEYMRAKGSANA